MNNQQWLMNSEVLTILRKLRKRLQAEFDICLRFSDANLEQQLARARDRSIDSETRRMIAELEERKGRAFSTGEEIPQRLYRGNPVLQEPETRNIYELIYGAELAHHDAARRHKVEHSRVYRGQPVLRDLPGATDSSGE
ncbi:hypothetical protein [Microbulbifer taiwanensis]|uniref:Uncharacterized protein n=1 Tax=Microbulbifer taiwanensis TaxID=986746 RepID=A0ABW1YJV9_9GAMM|nr:hypothetical protein [Microbulbifer taiwanensis]